jgi:hypothetical protein
VPRGAPVHLQRADDAPVQRIGHEAGVRCVQDQESVTQFYLDEMDELAPGLFDRDTPSGSTWCRLYAGITELGVDGF